MTCDICADSPLQVSRERKEVAKQLSVWGEECDDDVSDVTDKLGVLIFEIGELEDNFIGMITGCSSFADNRSLRSISAYTQANSKYSVFRSTLP